MAKYQNPVNRGFFPDPSIVRVGEDYYMVNSTFEYFPAVAISHSRDLVHWELIGHAITENDYLDLSEIPCSHGIWAPDISYHNGKFYIFAPLRLGKPGEVGGGKLRCQLIMSSDRPEGPYSKPIVHNIDAIDPSHFIDDDGTHYIIVTPGVQAYRLSDDLTRIESEKMVVWRGTGARAPEGPHLFKKDGWYYAMLAEGGTGYDHMINVARSREMFGEYTPSPINPALKQFDPNSPIQRAGHGMLVETQKGDWWCVYLCARPNTGNFTTIGRETALDKVEWNEDGWFVINGGHPSLEAECPDLPECVYPSSGFDGFDSPTLSKTWEFVRNPDWNDLSLTERPGWLRIYTGSGQLFELCARNTLVRREEEHVYTASTKLEFAPDTCGEQAGLTCYYACATYASWSLCWHNGRKLKLSINMRFAEQTLCELDAPEGAVYLRVDVDHLRRTFLYSSDGQDWKVGYVLEPCCFLADEGMPLERKRHTGTMVGVFANNGGSGTRKAADFDYFSYED